MEEVQLSRPPFLWIPILYLWCNKYRSSKTFFKFQKVNSLEYPTTFNFCNIWNETTWRKSLLRLKNAKKFAKWISFFLEKLWTCWGNFANFLFLFKIRQSPAASTSALFHFFFCDLYCWSEIYISGPLNYVFIHWVWNLLCIRFGFLCWN